MSHVYCIENATHCNVCLSLFRCFSFFRPLCVWISAVLQLQSRRQYLYAIDVWLHRAAAIVIIRVFIFASYWQTYCYPRPSYFLSPVLNIFCHFAPCQVRTDLSHRKNTREKTVIYSKIEPNGKQQTNKQNRQAKAIKTKSWLGQSVDKIEYNDSEVFCFGVLRREL